MNDTQKKMCRGCNIEKELSEFNKTYVTGTPKPLPRCKICRSKEQKAFYDNLPDKNRAYRSQRYKQKYGITIEDYETMVTKQDGKCGICKQIPPVHKFQPLLVDHCHKTGRVRKLLCTSCNTALGGAKDNIDILRSMITYLEENGYE